ncbi:MAG: hypothetical protein M0Z65_06670 [Firmicutes bacterium]|uniref:Uncharacterized protein n=1 Tax=Melghirimyces thermohalophilus TaxID=1236220 RepID=A0A1G6KQV3_9BACL|nr:hypothetical protein [Melghirimyces thermohalophilus]MDA8352863.1 hypothetical protein [Bacillota bacterium]SDC33482.1 hypothetical protein SAMN04488112_106116 [Melghirimyces thermohalophilus]
MYEAKTLWLYGSVILSIPQFFNWLIFEMHPSILVSVVLAVSVGMYFLTSLFDWMDQRKQSRFVSERE